MEDHPDAVNALSSIPHLHYPTLPQNPQIENSNQEPHLDAGNTTGSVESDSLLALRDSSQSDEHGGNPLGDQDVELVHEKSDETQLPLTDPADDFPKPSIKTTDLKPPVESQHTAGTAECEEYGMLFEIACPCLGA